MSNTINIGGMSSYYNSFIQSVTTKKTSRQETSAVQNTDTNGEDAFVSTIKSKMEVSEFVEIQGMKETTAVSTKDMSMEEYKQYISDKISSFPFHPSQASESYSINISDAGFEAMKNDPEYEKWVLDDLRTCFATPVPSWYQAMGGPSTYTIFNYGASKEEFSGQKFPVGVQGNKGRFDSNADNGFWSKRADNKEIQKRMDEKLIERKQQQKELMEEYIEERIMHQKEMSQWMNTMHYKKSENGNLSFSNMEIPMQHSIASAAYEANFMMSNGIGTM